MTRAIRLTEYHLLGLEIDDVLEGGIHVQWDNDPPSAWLGEAPAFRGADRDRAATEFWVHAARSGEDRPDEASDRVWPADRRWAKLDHYWERADQRKARDVAAAEAMAQEKIRAAQAAALQGLMRADRRGVGFVNIDYEQEFMFRQQAALLGLAVQSVATCDRLICFEVRRS